MKNQIRFRAGKILGIAGFGIFVFPLLAGAEPAQWKLEKNAEGIQVSTRMPEESAFKAFRGVTSAASSVDKAVALFEKNDAVCQWVYRCKNFQILEDENPNEKIIYFHQDMPWPVSDRDVVYHRLRKKDPATGAVIFSLTDIKNAYPEKKAGVRLKFLNGHWSFTPLAEGQIEIVYEQRVHPGGVLPKWLVNLLVVEIPFDTLKEFKALLEEET